MLLQQHSGRLRADATCAGNLVRRIAAKRNEVRHLDGVDAVTLTHLGRSDSSHPAAAPDGLENRRALAGELERIAIGRRYERRPATQLLLCHSRGQEVVRLIARSLATDDSRGSDQSGQQVELLEDVVVELSTRLIALQQRVAVGRDKERVPCDDDGPRLLVEPQTYQHRHEADERVPRPAVASADRAGQRVIRAMRERVTVHGQQGRGQSSDASSAVIAVCSRSVAVCAASPMGMPVRLSRGTGGPNATRTFLNRRS